MCLDTLIAWTRLAVRPATHMQVAVAGTVGKSTWNYDPSSRVFFSSPVTYAVLVFYAGGFFFPVWHGLSCSTRIAVRSLVGGPTGGVALPCVPGKGRPTEASRLTDSVRGASRSSVERVFGYLSSAVAAGM